MEPGADEVALEQNDPLPVCDAVGQVDALVLPKRLPLAEWELLLLCVSETVAQDV